MRILSVLLLVFMLPGAAFAQGAGQPYGTYAQSAPQSGGNSSDRCRQTYQACVRRCTGPDTQSCFSVCENSRVQCIQNPSGQRNPMRFQQ